MPNIVLSPEIKTRQDLALLCNARQLWRACEVGTDIGQFAREFLEQWKGTNFFVVDPYEPYEEMPYDRTGDMVVMLLALAKFHPKVKHIKARSPEATRLLPPWISLEFCYIDGSHLYEKVREDMAAWWERLYPGVTILAGHDYDEEHSGVMRAVQEFSDQHQRTVYLTDEGLPSWYIYKQDPKSFVRLFLPEGG